MRTLHSKLIFQRLSAAFHPSFCLLLPLFLCYSVCRSHRPPIATRIVHHSGSVSRSISFSRSVTRRCTQHAHSVSSRAFFLVRSTTIRYITIEKVGIGGRRVAVLDPGKSAMRTNDAGHANMYKRELGRRNEGKLANSRGERRARAHARPVRFSEMESESE